MDGQRFDRLTRMIASRRGVVRGLAAVVIGGSALGVADADARISTCRRGRQTCQRDNQCCSGQCRRGIEVQLKDRNRCACEDGWHFCGHACIDPLNDEHNCGVCGARCPAGSTCCGGECVDLRDNERHCGACGNDCASNIECVAGVCDDPCTGTTGKVYIDNDGNIYTGFVDSDYWDVPCTTNSTCTDHDECPGDPDRPCICRKRICRHGGTTLLDDNPVCVTLNNEDWE
jgi:hypothetical protein